MKTSPILPATEADLANFYPAHILAKFPSVTPWPNIDPQDWFSWTWQLQHRLQDWAALKEHFSLLPAEAAAAEQEQQKPNPWLRFKISPYYAALINPANPQDPLRAQAIPTIQETIPLPSAHEMPDPLAEERDMPVPGITHRYPDRVLFYVANDCATFCRHCTRKRKVGQSCGEVNQTQWQLGLKYISEHPQIRDVLVSGGDPFCLSTSFLDFLLQNLRAIKHVEVIRIGTRLLTSLPYRFLDDELIKVLAKYPPLFIHTHFNHPQEITQATLLAATRLANHGINLANQTVLLKKINDDAEIIKRLNHLLLLMRIRPYYLFQGDMTTSTGHFRTSIKKGLEILDALHGHTSAMAIPRYAIDLPYGDGKVPLLPNYLIKNNSPEITLRNYLGKTCIYWED